VEEDLFRREGVVTCLRCGERSRLPKKRRGEERNCPRCGSAEGIAWADQPRQTPSAPSIPNPDPAAVMEEEPPPDWGDEDDGRPYAVKNLAPAPLCPQCKADLVTKAGRCVACGCDVKAATRAAREYERIERHWETGWPLRSRLAVFLVVQAVLFPLGLAGALWEGEVVAFLFAWLPFTALLAFLLGTHSHLDLLRDRRGRVFLTKTWYICFIRQRGTPIDVRGYEGVHTAVSSENTVLDWAIFVSLLVIFVMPVVTYGIRTAVSSGATTINWMTFLGLLPMSVGPVAVFWYFGIKALSYTASLMQGHGFPELILYRGRSEAQMEDIAATLRSAYDFPYEQDYGRSTNTPQERP
jgi:hypothetical protein